MKATVLAIDPGTTHSAVVEWDGEKVGRADIVPNEIVIGVIHGSPASIILCEMVACYGMPVGREVFETCLWIGEFRHCCREQRPFELVYRRDVKLHHCGSARAKDGNVIQALKDKYGDKGTKANPGTTYKLKSHLWQAFAIATMWTESANQVHAATLREVSA
jgi:hypothetical protein